MIRLFALSVVLAALAGCATQERLSPCVCNWEPINPHTTGTGAPA